MQIKTFKTGSKNKNFGDLNRFGGRKSEDSTGSAFFVTNKLKMSKFTFN